TEGSDLDGALHDHGAERVLRRDDLHAERDVAGMCGGVAFCGERDPQHPRPPPPPARNPPHRRGPDGGPLRGLTEDLEAELVHDRARIDDLDLARGVSSWHDRDDEIIRTSSRGAHGGEAIGGRLRSYRVKREPPGAERDAR